MAKRKNPPAFDLKESQLDGSHAGVKSYPDLAQWLGQELDAALAARGNVAADIAYRWTYYEQGRTRGNGPWPDAADLTSPYATEFVDAILGRVMDTIMVDTLWIVDGWGESAKRAPFVEEFHQRTQEQERLQTYLREVLLRSLIEPRGILEISEAVEWRRERRTINAKLATDAMGAPVLGEDAQPELAQDASGAYIEAESQDDPQAETVIDDLRPVRLGPAYDVIPYLQFVQFPWHARTKEEIWGYGKQLWRRVPELKARAARGFYDAAAVDALGEADERGMSEPIAVDQRGPTAQKELWEIPFLADLDGEGERWYLATLSREHTKLLRLKVDDRTSRFIEFVPFPKAGSRDGYSLLEKMQTLIEEDTAVRNMRADMAALAISSPILRLQGALWDPYEQPLGPGAVIDVRDPKEISQPVQFRDVPQSLMLWKQEVRTDLERLVGMGDVANGTETQERRTLGEVQLTASYSEVRVKAIVKAIQESLEELGAARHDSWKRVLRQQQKGLPIPAGMMNGLDARGINIDSIADGRVTADMLEGQFWFKPRGSVETANLDRQAQYFTALLSTLGPLMQVNPMVRAIFQTPQAAKALVEQLLRVARWPDKQAFLGSEAQMVLNQTAQQMALQSDPRFQLMQHLAGAGAGGQPVTGAAGGATPAPSAGPPAQMPQGVM